MGVPPPISHQDAISLLENGYSQMLKDLIKDLKEKNRAWVRNGEVFFIQLLNCFVAAPIAVYYLSEAGKWIVVLSQLKELPLYIYIYIYLLVENALNRLKKTTVCPSVIIFVKNASEIKA